MTSASLPWLIRHELRLWAREGDRRGRVGRTIALVLLTLLPLAIGVQLAFAARGVPDLPAAALGPLSAAFAGLVLLMLSGACVYVLRSFHDRGDLDLLLAAPIPPARVLLAKSLAIHTAVALPLLFVLTPFLVTSAWLGHPGWLGGLLVIVIAAVIATSLAFVIVAALFRRLGARRARMLVQVGGGAFAVAAALLAQTPNIAPQLFQRMRAWLALTPPPPFDAPARAALGDPLWLLVLIAIAVAAAAASARLAADRLVAATPAEAVVASRDTAARFGSGLTRILLVKELQLLGRDAELLSSIVLQLAYMIPAFALIFSGPGASPARLAAACVLFCGLLAASLGWLTICGEDAPDLIAAAPVPPALVRRMKVAAACLPPLAIAAVPILITAGIDLRAGLAALLLAPVAAITAALQQGWAGRPQPRKTFRTRQKASWLLAVAEYAMAGAWATSAALLARGSVWVVASVAVASLVLLGSRLLFKAK